MRYWNSREILDRVFELMPLESESLKDMLIDFCVDLVEVHNFQIERSGDDANAQVAFTIAKFVSAFAVTIFEGALSLCDVDFADLANVYGKDIGNAAQEDNES